MIDIIDLVFTAILRENACINYIPFKDFDPKKGNLSEKKVD